MRTLENPHILWCSGSVLALWFLFSRILSTRVYASVFIYVISGLGFRQSCFLTRSVSNKAWGTQNTVVCQSVPREENCKFWMYHAIFFFVGVFVFAARKFPCCRLKMNYVALLWIWKAAYSLAVSTCFRVLYSIFPLVFSLENKSSSFKLSAHLKSLYFFSLLDSLQTSYWKWDTQNVMRPYGEVFTWAL